MPVQIVNSENLGLRGAHVVGKFLHLIPYPTLALQIFNLVPLPEKENPLHICGNDIVFTPDLHFMSDA